MVGYAYLFKRSDSGSEFIIVRKRDDFSGIPKWITDRIGKPAPFPELHLNSDVPLPGLNETSLQKEIDEYGYAVVEANFALRLGIA